LVNYGNQSSQKGMQIELLIDQSQKDNFTFLTEVDISVPGKNASETALRNYRLEEAIRGKNKVSVLVALMKPWWMESRGESTGNEYLQWAVSKLVPGKLFNKAKQNKERTDEWQQELPEQTDKAKEPDKQPVDKNGNSKKRAASVKSSQRKRRRTGVAIATGSRYMGDGNDAGDQQATNWRWAAGRFHEILLSEDHLRNLGSLSAEVLSAGFVAEVLKVDSSSSPSNGIPVTTLAMVTVRRMYLPEHTRNGRLPHQSPFEVFHDHDSRSEPSTVLHLPIEHLVIVSRMFQPAQHGSAWQIDMSNTDDVLEKLVVSDAYSHHENVYYPLDMSQNNEGGEDSSIKPYCCHQCHWVGGSNLNGNGEASKPKPSQKSILCERCENLISDVGNWSCECYDCQFVWDKKQSSKLSMVMLGREANGSLKMNSLFKCTNHGIRRRETNSACHYTSFCQFLSP